MRVMADRTLFSSHRGGLRPGGGGVSRDACVNSRGSEL